MNANYQEVVLALLGKIYDGLGGVLLRGALQAGTNITITGSGTIPDPYIISSTGGGSITITHVANYSALPDPTTVTENDIYIADSSQGTAWLPGSLGGTYYPAGAYYSNLTTWIYSESPYNATQATVNAGINNNQFVTALTLANSTQWNTKLTSTLTNGYIFVGNASNVAVGVLPSLSPSGGAFALSNTGVYTFPNADTSTRGLLTSTDWNTFNNKFTLPSLTSGSVLFSNGTTISQNNTAFFWDNTNSILYSGANSGAFTNTRIAAFGTVNDTIQITTQNLSNGTTASSDFVATADNGNNTSKYIDIGINSSGYTGNTSWGNALDGYVFVDGGDMWIGTNTAAKNLYFVTGGGLDANRRGFVNSTGGWNIGGATTMASGNLHEINGSITGSATFSLTSGVTNGTTTITYAANTTVKVGDRISGTNISTGTSIAYIVSSTQATLNQVASGSSSGITFTITPLVTGQNYLLSTTGSTGLFVTGGNYSPVVTGVGAAKNVIGYNFNPRLVGSNSSDVLIGFDTRATNYTGTLTNTNCHEFGFFSTLNAGTSLYLTTNNHTTMPRMQASTTNFVDFFNTSGLASLNITSSLASTNYLINLAASSTAYGITYNGTGTFLSCTTSNVAGVPVVALAKFSTGNGMTLQVDEMASATTNRGLLINSSSSAISMSVLSQAIRLGYTSTSGTISAGGGMGQSYFLKMNSTIGAVDSGGFYNLATNIGVGTEQTGFVWYDLVAGTLAERMRLDGANLGIGVTVPTSFLHIAAGTTAKAQIRLAAGVAPTSPNDGDFYYIDTNDRFMFRKNTLDAEIISASAVTTEALTSDTSLTITYNGTTYKILARA